VAIDTKTLTLGSPLPAKTSFSARTDPNADASPGPQTGSATGQPANPEASAAASPKSVGPSAQTRGKGRATRAPANAATSAASPGSTDPADVAQQTGSDFGSVMASALGRSAASTTDGSVPASSPTATLTASAATTTPAPADAVAWFAQALMPPAAGAPALAKAPGTGHAAAPAGATIGSVATGAAAAATGLPPGLGSKVADAQSPNALAAQLASQNAATAGQSPGTAPGTQPGALPALPTPVGPTNDAALSAAAASPAGNINALADVQKLISGLTAANSTDSDTDTDSAAPTTHATADGGGTDAAQAAAALQASALARPNGSLGGATLTIHAPVGSAAFADEVSTQAAGLARSGITQAQLQLNPADLGPVEVHITMQAGQASVWFGATHADTRAALEQSLPRLRELFAGAGMPLTDSGVFREPPQQQQAQSLSASSSSRTAPGDTAVAPTVTQVANIRLSLLDTYA
jgi:flagellar hook-length control protein FliK